MQQVKCACGNILAVRDGNFWMQRHKGRVTVCREVVAFNCERCGRDVVPGTDQKQTA